MVGRHVYDVIVVGGGIAGMVAALTAARTTGPVGARVALVTEEKLGGGSTRSAQGGIAVALGDDDSPAQHMADTVAAGRGLCDPRAVQVLVEEGPSGLAQLAAWGVEFDADASGWTLGQEAAHTRRRVVHSGGDATGLAMATALAVRVRAEGIEVWEDATVIRLLAAGSGGCAGAEVLASGTGPIELRAPATVLATGGAGRLWRRTSNPEGATGAGVALAYGLGAEVAAMEFTQFHPTALALPGAPAFLISETVRGEGATVLNAAGERFLLRADARGELAPRDTVATAIWHELRIDGSSHVDLDTAPVGPRAAERFPTIHRTLREYGLELGRDRIPVAPAAHYSIGGVRTDLDGATSVSGLFACGEVASTGVHGANRLASNSLLEGVVFGRRAGRAARALAAEAPAPAPASTSLAVRDSRGRDQPAAVFAGLQDAMWLHAGLIRDEPGLRRLSDDLAALGERAARLPFPSSVALGAATRTASLICQAASLREESRGSHQRSDHPAADDEQLGTWVLQHERGHHLDRNRR